MQDKDTTTQGEHKGGIRSPLLPFDDPSYTDEVVREFHRYVVRLEKADMAHALARNIGRFLDARPSFEKEDPDTFQKLRKTLVEARFLSIPLLKDEEVVDLLGSHLEEAFALGIDIVDYVRRKLAALFAYDDRDALKEKLRRALAENTSVLFSPPIAVAGGARKAKTVEDVVKGYVRAFGPNKVDPVKRSEYMNREYNFSAQDKEVQSAIKGTIELYEFLKVSSWDLESDEEPIILGDEDGLKVFKGGRFENVAQDRHIAGIIQELKEHGFLEGGKEGGAAEKEEAEEILARKWADFLASGILRSIERIRREGGETGAMREKMYEAIHKKDTAGFAGRIAHMIGEGKLREVFHADQRYIAFWKKHLARHWDGLRQWYPSAKTEEDAQTEFVQDPASARQMAIFIREVLRKRMGLEEEESAMVGAYLGNIARASGQEEYSRLAYGDMRDGVFKWNITEE